MLKMIINKIAAFRKAKHMSQDQLARDAGISVRSVSTAENNIEITNFKTLQKIANSLDVKICDLFEELDKK